MPNDQWSKSFTGLLKEALLLKKTFQLLGEILQRSINTEHKKRIAFKNRICEYQQYLFRFLYHYDVPADNNASERSVRTFHVKQKVSELFRTQEEAKAFAVIRSIIDTVLKILRCFEHGGKKHG